MYVPIRANRPASNGVASQSSTAEATGLLEQVLESCWHRLSPALAPWPCRALSCPAMHSAPVFSRFQDGNL